MSRDHRFVRWRRWGVCDRPFAEFAKAHCGDLRFIDASLVGFHLHGANDKLWLITHRWATRAAG